MYVVHADWWGLEPHAVIKVIKDIDNNAISGNSLCIATIISVLYFDCVYDLEDNKTS